VFVGFRGFAEEAEDLLLPYPYCRASFEGLLSSVETIIKRRARQETVVVDVPIHNGSDS
jgi:hypothetical protein